MKDTANALSLLISKGGTIDVKLEEEYGLSPLHLACRNGHLEVVRFLLKVLAFSFRDIFFLSFFFFHFSYFFS